MNNSYISDANNYFRTSRDYLKQVILEQTEKAEIILTSLGERAIAISTRNKRRSPKIIAKGDLDLVKLIYDIAENNKIKIVKNEKLTNYLFEKIDINDYMPCEYWDEIARMISNKNNSINPFILNNDSTFVFYDPICIELGYGLVPLAEKEKGGDLFERISWIRTVLLYDFGLAIPTVRIIDNSELNENEYQIILNGV